MSSDKTENAKKHGFKIDENNQIEQPGYRIDETYGKVVCSTPFLENGLYSEIIFLNDEYKVAFAPIEFEESKKPNNEESRKMSVYLAN